MFKLTTTFFLTLFTLSLFSQQTGSIQGRIFGTDSLPVSNASIRFLNTEKGGISNASGIFKITGVLPGKYLMEISAIGYSQKVSSVEIVDGKQSETDFYLEQRLSYLDEVVVSAEKSEMQLQKIPVAITAFTSREIAEFRLWNIQEITGLVPNLYSSNPGDNRNATSIRGIGTTSYDPAVVTYVDGVNQFNLDTYIPQLTDVERIEILRGPQGTLYGRNAMGGVINIITKKPGNKTETFVELNAGNFAQQRYTAGFKTPIIPGKLFAGVALQYQSRKGFFENLYTENDFDRQRVITGNYYLKYIPSEKWSIIANIKHVNNRNKGAFPLAPDKETAFREPYTVNQNATATMQD
ncbi:MAG: TonB-dependent receptor, partial [Chitinophagaceae bacterium]